MRRNGVSRPVGLIALILIVGGLGMIAAVDPWSAPPPPSPVLVQPAPPPLSAPAAGDEGAPVPGQIPAPQSAPPFAAIEPEPEPERPVPPPVVGETVLSAPVSAGAAMTPPPALGSSEAVEAPRPAEVALVRPLAVPPPPPARLPAPPAGTPMWKRHAVAPPVIAGRPMIVVIIDDLGVDRRRAERVVALPGPLTLSFMSYADGLDRLTVTARRHGHELMVHVPMQPRAERLDAGREVLTVGQTPDEIRRHLDWALSRFDGYIGINNHMGSRFTADTPAMRVVMAEMRRRGLAFVDSVTTDQSVGAVLARQYGVPFAARNVFLDNDQSVESVRGQLAKLETHARRHGFAIAIGHPHDGTIAALADWLPGLSRRGLVLVPVSAILRAPAAESPR